MKLCPVWLFRPARFGRPSRTYQDFDFPRLRPAGPPTKDPIRFKRFKRLGRLERFGQLPAELSQIPSWARRVPYQAVRTVRLDNKEGKLVPQTRTAWL